MFKVFISQSMNGLSDGQIFKARTEAWHSIREEMGQDVHFVGSMMQACLRDDVPSRVKNSPLWCLGESIKKLAEADVAYFLDGWADSNECIIEHAACVLYGINIIKE